MKKLLKVFWGLVILAGAVFAYSFFIEPNIIKVESQDFDLNCLEQNSQEKIIQISDLHFSGRTSQGRVEKIAKKIKAESPSFIFVTGDLVGSEAGKEPALALAKELSSIAKTYIIFGNWDYDVFGAGALDFKKELEGAGANVLIDEVGQIQLGQETVNLAGIKDIRWTANPEGSLRKLLGQISSPEQCRILLAHNPDVMKSGLAQEFDLVLAGHTHGGQVYLPFITKQILLNFVGGKDYPRGRFKIGETWLYVNRGLGGSKISLRFLSVPEITILRVN